MESSSSAVSACAFSAEVSFEKSSSFLCGLFRELFRREALLSPNSHCLTTYSLSPLYPPPLFLLLHVLSRLIFFSKGAFKGSKKYGLESRLLRKGKKGSVNVSNTLMTSYRTR